LAELDRRVKRSTLRRHGKKNSERGDHSFECNKTKKISKRLPRGEQSRGRDKADCKLPREGVGRQLLKVT